jgi:hypothetical protein
LFIKINITINLGWGYAVAQWFGHCAQNGRSRDRFLIVSLEFFIDIILPAALGSGVDLASNRNEYQGNFLEVKVAGAQG